VNVRADRITNKPKGFAFVTFENPEAAQAAIRGRNGFSIQGRPLKVALASLRGQQLGGTSEPVDNSWKTVPTTKDNKKSSNNKDGKSTTKPAVRTWDHWAGPSGPSTANSAPKTGKK